jgi:hypothetical protein
MADLPANSGGGVPAPGEKGFFARSIIQTLYKLSLRLHKFT